MMVEASPPPTIVVIGAGVIGLTTALTIQDQIKSVEVFIVAEEWPTAIAGGPLEHSADYASMWAGAHVRPIPATNEQLVREAAWLKYTAGQFARQVKDEPWLGVTAVQGVEYLEDPPEGYKNQTQESFERETGLTGFRLHEEAGLPLGVRLGFEYDTYCLNAPMYCASLLRKFIVRGGRTLKKKLVSEWEAFSLLSKVVCVVNASGRGFGDPACFPTRGQTVVTDFVDATKTVTRQNRDGTWSFIIPRFFNGGTIIGGTKEPSDWETEPRPETQKALLENGRFISDFAQVDNDKDLSRAGWRVIADVVGRRPTREGGMRIESQGRKLLLPDQSSDLKHVVHAYGAGGRGYEISWGVANEVVGSAKALGGMSMAILPTTVIELDACPLQMSLSRWVGATDNTYSVVNVHISSFTEW